MGQKQIQEIEEEVELEVEYLKRFQGTPLCAYSVSVIIDLSIWKHFLIMPFVAYSIAFYRNLFQIRTAFLRQKFNLEKHVKPVCSLTLGLCSYCAKNN